MTDAPDKSNQGGGHEIPLDEVRHPETMYDRSDLSARGIVYFLVMLAMTIVAIHLVLWGFVRYVAHHRVTPAPRNAAIVTPSSQGRKGDPVQRFPAPQLQPDEVGDLNKFRAIVEQQLNSAGTGKIPIEQSIDSLAKSGLPVRAEPALPPRAHFGSGDSTPAGSGGGTGPKGNQ